MVADARKRSNDSPAFELPPENPLGRNGSPIPAPPGNASTQGVATPRVVIPSVTPDPRRVQINLSSRPYHQAR